ncbi:DUF4328 domain-containing protein [Flavobacterium sp. ALJ2]|uniref:DUF4328 domain-containing protein n=1 Tax=Flavobacterium sp. ALJ2 TaxID=2786960 RepID=UPI00189DB961|nr:DUF4328 domain-containing protein [Flavobacterium sp. ALJ2]MBF7091544.1 DUF4328 domain-containing protein [Flavobacterium sp. ALJ2]
MNELRPNGQRAKNAILLIWIILSLKIVSLISSFLQYDMIQTAAAGGTISTDVANANDSREQVIGIIYLIAYVVSGVTFIQWFRRAYFNLHIITRPLSHTEGWAAGSWFLPFINLYRPYQIMAELYEKTKSFLDRNKITTTSSLSTATLAVWWTLWIISNILGQIVFRYSMKAITIDQLNTSTILSIVLNVIGIPLALITIKVIKDYSQIEPLLIQTEESKKQHQPVANLIEQE